jgi:predicted transcriptional regulator of viral defense system
MQHVDKKLALYHLAETQAGFFTAKQAEEHGFEPANYHHFVKTGEWTRLGRGLYRLALMSSAQRQDFWELYFWSRNRADKPQGIFSHESALDLYDLTDELPSQIHMTVPGDFRRNSKFPAVLRLYKEDLKSEDVQLVDGLPCTTPMKTIIDLRKRGAPDSLIHRAIDEATQRGLLTRRSLDQISFRRLADG